MKKIKLVKTIIMIASISTLISCGNLRKEAANKIVEELNNRYDKSFVVDSMGGSWGTSDDTTIKAWTYEDGHRDEMFKAAIKKDFSEVKDEYQIHLIKEQLQPKIEDVINPILGDTHTILYLGNVLTSNNNQYTNLSDYFKENEYAGLSFEIFVKSYEDIDKDLETQKIKEVLKSLNELDYNITGLSILYTKEDSFDKFQNNLKDIKDDGKYYKNKDCVYNYSWIDVRKDNMLNLTDEYILNSFEW